MCLIDFLYKSLLKHLQFWPASWSSGQRFLLLIMRSRVRLPVMSFWFFLEVEYPHSGHGLGSLVELRFKVPPGTSYPYITIHSISIYHHPLHIHISPSTSSGQRNFASWASQPQESVTGRGDHEVHKGHVVAVGRGKVEKSPSKKNSVRYHKCTSLVMKSTGYCWWIFIETEFSWQILENWSDIKFNENVSFGSRVIPRR
jgi:hypothetical protein